MRKIWKRYRRSIASSLVVILALITLIYASSTQGRFVWFAPPLSVSAEPILLALTLSLLVFLLVFVAFSLKFK